jgi:flagellar protein FlaG
MMVGNISSVRTVKTQSQAPNSGMVQVSDSLPKGSDPGGKAGAEVKISQDMLENVEQDIQLMYNVGLHFSVHDATGRTMITVVDKATETLIREIPPEDFLNLSAKIDEMIGIIFDKKV